jgi:hypothetical protein
MHAAALCNQEFWQHCLGFTFRKRAMGWVILIFWMGFREQDRNARGDNESHDFLALGHS